MDDSGGLYRLGSFLAADAFVVGAVLWLLGGRAVDDRRQRRYALALASASVLYALTAAVLPFTTAGGQLSVPGTLARGAVLTIVVLIAASTPGLVHRAWIVAFLSASVVLRVGRPVLPGGLDGYVPGLTLAGALLLAGVAASDFRARLRAGGTQEDALALELATTRARLDGERQAERARLHDARSAVAGVLGASAVLDDAQLPVADRETLQHLIAAEIHRLAGVLGLDPEDPIVEFDLREALLPVLRSHRLVSPQLTWSVPALRATGRPRSTATALDNVLRNAEIHAPGAPVRVAAEQRDGVVELTVEDDGPGIPARERQLVILPGVRGSSAGAAGTGLGLANAASAMAAQDGDLRIDAAVGGGTRVTLQLPAAAAMAAAC